MVLKGTVRNVIDFGAFVDIGVHQDGLVHISQMSDKTFVKHPLDVVSVGDIVDVKVLSVDMDRKRIALTMKLEETGETGSAAGKIRDARRPGPKKHDTKRPESGKQDARQKRSGKLDAGRPDSTRQDAGSRDSSRQGKARQKDPGTLDVSALLKKWN